MKEVRANLWDYHPEHLIAITTNGMVKNNGACVMGRGCAKEARDKYPGLDFALGKHIRAHGNTPCMFPNHNIVTFPVKHHWNQPADENLIRISAVRIKGAMDARGIKDIYIPRPGCGNGSLNWEAQVKPILEPIFNDDRFIIVTF